MRDLKNLAARNSSLTALRFKLSDSYYHALYVCEQSKCRLFGSRVTKVESGIVRDKNLETVTQSECGDFQKFLSHDRRDQSKLSRAHLTD